MGSNDGPCFRKHEYGTENENRRAKNCAKCKKVKIYIAKRSKNADNSQTRRNFKILTSDSESGRGFTSTMRFRNKSETKNFSTFRGGAGGVAARKSKNKSHSRGPWGQTHKLVWWTHPKSEKKYDTTGLLYTPNAKNRPRAADKKRKTPENAKNSGKWARGGHQRLRL